MNVADLIEGPVVARPAEELPAPATVAVRAADLEAYDVVVVRGREAAVDVHWTMVDGTVRFRTDDGTTHTCGPEHLWEVRRG